jgi:hypothetical protein
VRLLSSYRDPEPQGPSSPWPALDGRAKRGRRQQREPLTALSALDQLATYERLAQSQGYFGKPPEVDNFQRAERMLDIQAHALQIDDEARSRTEQRRLAIANGWLSFGLRLLGVLVITSLVVLGCLAVNRAEVDQLLRWIASFHGLPFVAALGLGGCVTAVVRAVPNGQAERDEAKPEGYGLDEERVSG